MYHSLCTSRQMTMMKWHMRENGTPTSSQITISRQQGKRQRKTTPSQLDNYLEVRVRTSGQHFSNNRSKSKSATLKKNKNPIKFITRSLVLGLTCAMS